MSDGNEDNYEVGYGKPPKGSMFKKGQSGNPKGRRKRVKNFKTELQDILGSKVTIKVAGRPTSVSTVKAALMRLQERALKGDPRALSVLLAYAEDNSKSSEDRSRERQLTKLEQEILDRSELFGEIKNPESSGDA